MESNQSPPPVFETDEACTYFLTTLPVNSEAKAAVSDQVSDQVSKLLTYASAPRTREELLAYLGLTNHLYNYRRHIKPLLDQGWLAMTVPSKPRSRNQRYQLTTQGAEVLIH